jgi:hypothetical protein
MECRADRCDLEAARGLDLWHPPNQIWSFADAGGHNDRPEVNQMFLQPFLAYTWRDSTTLTLNSESTFDWTAEEWTVPINLQRSATFTISAISRSASPLTGGSTPRPLRRAQNGACGPSPPSCFRLEASRFTGTIDKLTVALEPQG